MLPGCRWLTVPLPFFGGSRTDADPAHSFASAVIVANSVPSSLDKFFTQRDLFRGRSRRAWLWSVLATLLLLPLVVTIGLFAGLLVERGRLAVDLSRDELPRFVAVTGLSVAVDAQVSARVQAAGTDAGGEPQSKAPDEAVREDATIHFVNTESGILPAVWHSRGHWWGGALAWCFRRFDWLGSNVLATIALLLVGTMLATCRAACLARHRRECSRAALEAVAGPRKNLHRQVLRLGPEDLDGSGQSLASQLFSGESEEVRRGLATWIERETRCPLELACLALIVFSIQPMLAAQTVLLLGVVWYLLDTDHRNSEGQRSLAADRAAGEMRTLVEGFRTARLVRGLGLEQSEHDRFSLDLQRCHELAEQEDVATESVLHPKPLIVAFCGLIIGFLCYLFACKVFDFQGQLMSATGGMFVASIAFAIPSVRAIINRLTPRHVAALAAENIQRHLEQIPAVGQAVGAKFVQPLGTTLHFDAIKYRTTGGRLLLDGLDLKLAAGRTYALVSADPLEARALVSLLPRFIEPQSGRVFFDGEDIAWATLESLRAETVFVGADDPPLAGTVLDNLRGGNGEYTLQQATDAAKTSHAHNFIVKLFNGYETVLAGHGDSLDAGQRFRLALARAVLRNPAVLIIEEPRENLDEDTKSLLADAYDRICPNRTVLFLPGRLSTVKRSDDVIVLHEGRVAAIGPQSRLVSHSTIYRHWEYLNFNEYRSQE